jgi:prepilin-type processing-associated H-X9-DG protein
MTPFPAADLMGNPSNAGVGGAALGTSILLPSLNRARETANRIKSASNLKQMGLTILLYCNDHKAAYPPDLGTIFESGDLGLSVAVSPRSETSIPKAVKEGTAAVKSQWVNDHSDYVFTGKGLTNNIATPDMIIAYERSVDMGKGGGANALFGDGHVEFLNPEAFKQKLAASNEAIAAAVKAAK